jgi:hypothetical protein
MGLGFSDLLGDFLDVREAWGSWGEVFLQQKFKSPRFVELGMFHMG